MCLYLGSFRRNACRIKLNSELLFGPTINKLHCDILIIVLVMGFVSLCTNAVVSNVRPGGQNCSTKDFILAHMKGVLYQLKKFPYF